MKHSKQEYYLNHEQWKYTKISYFKNYNSNYAIKNDPINKTCGSNEILLHNGEFINAGSEILKNKIVVCGINDALKNDNPNLNKNFNAVIPSIKDSFLNDNKKYFSKGYYLYIPNDLEIIEPIIINNISDKGDEKSFTNFRNFIFCDKNSKVKIINYDSSNISQCANIVNETFINDNSELEIINESYKPKTQQISNFSAKLNKNSRLILHALDFGGRLLKSNYYINLNQSGSECLFNGFNIAKSNHYIDNYIEILHNNKNTKSDLNYKIISTEKSKSILFAKAIIKKYSSNSEAYQNNHNLILSEQSTIHSNPQLEIYNDDVKCSHGSTTGQMDDDVIHYMRTRGININDAKKLILEGFLDDVIKNISKSVFTVKLIDNIKQCLKDI